MPRPMRQYKADIRLELAQGESAALRSALYTANARIARLNTIAVVARALVESPWPAGSVERQPAEQALRDALAMPQASVEKP